MTKVPSGHVVDVPIERDFELDFMETQTCPSNFDAKKDGLELEHDDHCTSEKESEIKNGRSCPGDPHDDDFFKVDGTHDFYYKRRHALFNLYAFDHLRTGRIHAPELQLVECDFNYFLDPSYEALVVVETNNLGLLGSKDTQSMLGHYGEDRGARINITTSTFKNSKFCKGLVVYRPLKTFETANSHKIVSFASHLNENLSEESLGVDRSTSYINIHDSVFENLAYT